MVGSRRTRPKLLPLLAASLLVAPLVLTKVAAAQENQPPAVISVTPGQGNVGTTVNLTGRNFFSPEGCGQVRVAFDSTLVGDATMTDPDGDGLYDIALTFAVPGGASPGPVTVRAAQSRPPPPSAFTAGCSRSAQDTFQLLSFVVDPASGPPGATTTGRGAGFEPDVAECGPVAIRFDGTLLTNVTPQADGTFTVPLSVPGRPPATYMVEANQGRTCGRGGDIAADDDFTVVGPTTLTVDPGTGPAGSSTTGTGTGFTRDLPLVIEFDGDVVVTRPAGSTVFTSPSAFRTPLTIPDRPPGEYTVVACQPDCPSAQYIARTRFVVRQGPGLTVDPAEGPIGAASQATGTGFQDGLDAALTFGPEAVPVATVPGAAVAGGAFTVEIVIPDGVPGGPQEVVACQRCGTDGEIRATAVFTVTARLTVDPEIGPPGLVTTAEGDGFPADADIALAWVPGIGGTTVRSDASGTIRAQVLIMHRDALGPRQLQAHLLVPPAEAPPDDPAAPEVLPLATADFLVVPGSQQPASFVARR